MNTIKIQWYKFWARRWEDVMSVSGSVFDYACDRAHKLERESDRIVLSELNAKRTLRDL